MSDTPLRDASLAKLDDLPKRRVEVGLVAENGDAGGTLEASVPVTKWGTFTAAGQWMKDTGYRVAAKLGFQW